MHMKKKIKTNFFCESNYWSKRMLKIKEIVKNVIKIDNLHFNKNKFYILNLVFIDDQKIKTINHMYRKKNISTDVLTFVNYLQNSKNKNEIYCDIFFSAQTITKDAKNNLIDFYDHLTHLIVHCFLHINGYNHKKESDFMKMKSVEEKILIKLDIKSPYIL